MYAKFYDVLRDASISSILSQNHYCHACCLENIEHLFPFLSVSVSWYLSESSSTLWVFASATFFIAFWQNYVNIRIFEEANLLHEARRGKARQGKAEREKESSYRIYIYFAWTLQEIWHALTSRGTNTHAHSNTGCNCSWKQRRKASEKESLLEDNVLRWCCFVLPIVFNGLDVLVQLVSVCLCVSARTKIQRDKEKRLKTIKNSH